MRPQTIGKRPPIESAHAELLEQRRVMPLRTARKHPEAIAALLVIGGGSWWWTVERMGGMDTGPGTNLGTFGWFSVSWLAMMAAMMLPSFGPTLTAYAAAAGGRRPVSWLAFGSGYLLTWTAAGVLAYGIFELGKELLGSQLAWTTAGQWLCGVTLAAAAIYELLPVKQACLARCRGQFEGLDDVSPHCSAATLKLGVRSGGWCIGSSGALMLALFALGVMDLTWMALIATLVAVEKTCPWPVAARVGTAMILTALAAGVLLAPHQVPGFTVPGSGTMHNVTMMSTR